MEIRAKILEAAARVYSQHGFRGATTRLIAQEADVNEVTLFRTFGSKEALIEEAAIDGVKAVAISLALGLSLLAALMLVKPLVRLGERETAAWCVLRGIDYIVEECPMADGNKHLGYKEALNAIEAHSEETAMIGDRMDTDIIAGMEAGLHTVLVLTGITQRADIDAYPFRPAQIVDSVQDLIEQV